jgi:hypothetical protein
MAARAHTRHRGTPGVPSRVSTATGSSAIGRRTVGEQGVTRKARFHTGLVDARSRSPIFAHYADAIPPAVLKRGQDRILVELDQVNRRLDAHHGIYTDAREHLDDALNLLGNCADIYVRCADANRRLCD